MIVFVVRSVMRSSFVAMERHEDVRTIVCC